MMYSFKHHAKIEQKKQTMYKLVFDQNCIQRINLAKMHSNLELPKFYHQFRLRIFVKLTILILKLVYRNLINNLNLT